MLLYNSDVADSQRVPVLSAAAAAASHGSECKTNEDLTDLVTYESVAAVIRQLDQGSSSATRGNIGRRTTLWSNAIASHQRSPSRMRHPSHTRRKKLSDDELRDYKLKTACTRCGKFGHWAVNHQNDGSVRHGLPSNDASPSGVAQMRNPTHGLSPTKALHKSPSNAVLQFNTISTSLHLVNADAVTCPSSHKTRSDDDLGPLVDGGAPYSAIGVVELSLVGPSIMQPSSKNFDPIPAHVSHYKWWQYGAGEHVSPRRKILGSVLLSCLTDNSRLISIRHLVVEGSSQWVIGRNLTRKCNHLHIDDNRIQLPPVDGYNDFISLQDNETHSFIPLNRFLQCAGPSSRPVPALAAHSATTVVTSNNEAMPTENETNLARPLSEISRIVNRVYNHVCGHASFGDIRTLLQRNHLWNSDVQKMLSNAVEKCTHCIAAAPPASKRVVSIAGINRKFNDVICVDHFWLDNVCLFHVMDHYSGYSVVQPVSTTSLSEAIVAFENLWISQFWPPEVVRGDLAFRFDMFVKYLSQYDVDFEPVPPRRHYKNLIEPKHGVIRAIFLRLKDASPQANSNLLAVTATRISNEMYGSDSLSAYEISKGFSKPIHHSCLPNATPAELISAHDEIQAKRKLTRMLRSNVSHQKDIQPGDLVQVYHRSGDNKKGKWLSPRAVLKYEPEPGIVTVTSSSGRKMHVAVEDVRAAVCDNELAKHIMETNDQLDDIIDAVIDENTPDSTDMPDAQLGP